MHHPGEIAVQRRAGVPAVAHGSARVGNDVPPAAEAFLHAQRMIVVAAEQHGAMWTSVMTGPPGFVRHHGDATFRITGNLPAADPLQGAFDTPRAIGMIAIEPESRRRMRINGRAHTDGDALVVEADQVLANCPKYIATRHPEAADRVSSPTATARDDLSEAQLAWVRTADTFFIGTTAAGLGADASHRGGNPGFITASPGRLSWPDYVGNSMYMTLGNLSLDPRAGLLFIDWERGRTLHVRGTATVDWDDVRTERWPGAQRVVDLEVEHVVEVSDRVPLRWAFERLSRFSPATPSEGER
jgi:predicted pyridoxine 5'-phosphate oxidase superfamily flavin-nucleotide-binding protein